VASERSDKPGEREQAHERRECMPCRGTGRVISKLGGETSVVACPWCEGSGTRIAGIDAQAHWPRTDGPGGEQARSGEEAQAGQRAEPREQGTGERDRQDAPPAGDGAATSART
jgi:hypothetical protein